MSPSIPPYDQCPLLYYNLLDLLKQYNGNAIRMQCGAEGILNDPTLKSWFAEAIIQCKEKGITGILSSHDVIAEYWTDRWSYKAQVILNEDGAGDDWIQKWSQVIADLQPQAIEIMNEPPDANLSGTPNLTFEAWRNFCIKAINAYRAVKPDITILVDGCPFWEPGTWASNPLPFSNIYYVFHLHYGVNGLQPPPPEDWLAYKWINAYYTGNLTQAKIFLEDYLLNSEGMAALLDKGLPIVFGECGTSMAQPNWDAWLTDMYAIVAKYNVGWLQFSFGANPPDVNGILESDWNTLNPMGFLWQQIMPTPTPILATFGMAGLGAAVGYALKPKHPVVPMLVGAGVGAGIGFILDRLSRS